MSNKTLSKKLVPTLIHFAWFQYILTNPFIYCSQCITFLSWNKNKMNKFSFPRLCLPAFPSLLVSPFFLVLVHEWSKKRKFVPDIPNRNSNNWVLVSDREEEEKMTFLLFPPLLLPPLVDEVTWFICRVKVNFARNPVPPSAHPSFDLNDEGTCDDCTGCAIVLVKWKPYLNVTRKNLVGEPPPLIWRLGIWPHRRPNLESVGMKFENSR